MTRDFRVVWDHWADGRCRDYFATREQARDFVLQLTNGYGELITADEWDTDQREWVPWSELSD